MGWKDKDGFKQREYESYEEYLDKQAEKLDNQLAFARKCSDDQWSLLSDRISEFKEHLPPKGSVVCLGSRLGGEVRAFLDKGYFAVGVDINPGEKNETTFYGDFHDLIFPDKTVNIVYTNCLDHALHMDKLVNEVHRILKPSGVFYTENKAGAEEVDLKRAGSDLYDCLQWAFLKDLVEFITARGFTIEHTYTTSGLAPHGVIFKKQ